MSEQETTTPEQPEPEIPLPEPSINWFTLSLRMEAEAHLGLFHTGEAKDRPKPNLAAARHAIDMLALLQDKTKGNLTFEEQRLLENSLTELRFRYVQIFEESKRAPQS
jgi:hypothetical protein